MQNFIATENQKITFNTKLSDTDSKFSIADSRFQPGKASYYRANANVMCLVLIEQIIMATYAHTKTVISL